MEIILSLLEYRKEKNDESFIKLNTVLKNKINYCISKYNYLGKEEIEMSLSEAICLVNKEFKIIKISEAKKLGKEDYIYLDNFTKDYLLNDKYLDYKKYSISELYDLFCNENMLIDNVKNKFLSIIKSYFDDNKKKYIDIEKVEIAYEKPKERFNVRDILTQHNVFKNISFTKMEKEVLNFIFNVNEIVPDKIIAESFEVTRQLISKVRKKAFDKIRNAIIKQII